MNPEAILMMLTVNIAVTTITGYFFWKVLTLPKHQEPDSFSEND